MEYTAQQPHQCRTELKDSLISPSPCLRALLLFKHPGYISCHYTMLLVSLQLLIPCSSQAGSCRACSCKAAAWPIVPIPSYCFLLALQSICWDSLVACPADNMSACLWVLLRWELLYVMYGSKEIWHVTKPSNITFSVSDTLRNSGGLKKNRPKLNFYCSVILLHLV